MRHCAPAFRTELKPGLMVSLPEAIATVVGYAAVLVVIEQLHKSRLAAG